MKRQEIENALLKRLKRRLAGCRATAYLEFAVIAPLAISFVIFAADFTQILYTEQQMEIGARATADIQCHLGCRGEATKVPDKKAKVPVKFYLAEIARVTSGTEYVYLRGHSFKNENPLTALATFITDVFKGKAIKDSKFGAFWNLILRFIGDLLYLATFGTTQYISETIPLDRGVQISCACVYQPILPSVFYSYWYMKDADNGYIGVVQSRPEFDKGHIEPEHYKTNADVGDIRKKLLTDERYRYCVCMPVLESSPLAYQTITKKIRNWGILKPYLKN